MKRIISILGIIAVAGLCACGASNTGATAGTVPQATKEEVAVGLVSERVEKYKDSLDNPNAVYIAEVKNIGSKAVKLSDISIDLEGADGKIINTTTLVSAYPSAINPGESSYICESVLGFGQKTALDKIGDAVMHYDVKETDQTEAPAVVITEDAMSEAYNATSIVGRIENKSGKDLTDLRLVAPIVDKSGKIQTIAFAIVDSLKANDKIGFKMNEVFGNPDIDFDNCTYSIIAYIK